MSAGVSTPNGGIQATVFGPRGLNTQFQKTSIDGSRPASISYIVDGLSDTDFFFTKPTNIPPRTRSRNSSCKMASTPRSMASDRLRSTSRSSRARTSSTAPAMISFRTPSFSPEVQSPHSGHRSAINPSQPKRPIWYRMNLEVILADRSLFRSNLNTPGGGQMWASQSFVDSVSGSAALKCTDFQCCAKNSLVDDAGLKFLPRVGFALSLSDSNRAVLRGGYGILMEGAMPTARSGC